MKAFMTIPEAAILWGIAPRELRWICENHRIHGAVRLQRRWFIPEDALRPATNGSSTSAQTFLS